MMIEGMTAKLGASDDSEVFYDDYRDNVSSLVIAWLCLTKHCAQYSLHFQIDFACGGGD